MVSYTVILAATAAAVVSAAPAQYGQQSYDQQSNSQQTNDQSSGAGAWQPSQPSQPPAQPPTGTNAANPSIATHRVIAGFNGLHFEPENIVAEIGDLVEVHFNPMNHSFAQSSFDSPCVPINDDAIFSGFQPTPQGEAPEVFTITVKDKSPLWFYCAQTKGSHCQMGMAMAVNQNFDSDKTLANYKTAAAGTGVSIPPPKPGNGGFLAPPPNGPGL